MAYWDQSKGWTALNLPTQGVDTKTASKNNQLNTWSRNLINYFSNAAPGTYVSSRDNLPVAELSTLVSQGELTPKEANTYVDNAKQAFKDYYVKTKVTPWDASLGVKPATGDFDSAYYASRYPDAKAKWNEAVAKDDVDVISRYSKDNYMLQDFTRRTLSGEADLRGAPTKPLTASAQYKEKLTDAEYQEYRDQILGLATPDQPVTALEIEFQKAIQTQDAQKQQVFGALTQDVLKQTINEMKRAKQKESNLGIMKNLTGYDEVTNIKSTLLNSLLGDTGVGGVLSLGGTTGLTEEQAKNKIAALTGLKTSNSTIYNWQQWFDNVLTKRYEGGATIQDPVQADRQYQIDKDFASKFITDYLKPRFDTSKSMDEFVSYIDIKQGEENIFQTQKVFQSQSALDSLRTLADTRAKAYLDGLQNKAALNFDPEFYFNPTGNTERVADYAKQSQQVNADWEAAKKGDPYWAQQAYQYGIDLNNKEQFARLHYEVKGVIDGYDAAKDVITLDDATNYISNSIIPAVVDKQIAIDDASFLKLVTPEEFANKMLEGVDPTKSKDEWNKILTQFGIKDSGQGIDEIKSYITDALRTGAAGDIRKSIEYLNQKRVAPTQEKLGVSYIQRPEDAQKTTITGETALYQIFKKSGYQGTEDDFYNNFMPDVDRNEQVALTKAGTGKTFSISGVSTADPFSALSSIESFFTPSTSTTTSGTTSTGGTSSYLKLLDDTSTDSATSKSKSGQAILGEFTSMFKGFM